MLKIVPKNSTRIYTITQILTVRFLLACQKSNFSYEQISELTGVSAAQIQHIAANIDWWWIQVGVDEDCFLKYFDVVDTERPNIPPIPDTNSKVKSHSSRNRYSKSRSKSASNSKADNASQAVLVVGSDSTARPISF